jgi:hypothetical protein
MHGLCEFLLSELAWFCRHYQEHGGALIESEIAPSIVPASTNPATKSMKVRKIG